MRYKIANQTSSVKICLSRVICVWKYLLFLLIAFWWKPNQSGNQSCARWIVSRSPSHPSETDLCDKTLRGKDSFLKPASADWTNEPVATSRGVPDQTWILWKDHWNGRSWSEEIRNDCSIEEEENVYRNRLQNRTRNSHDTYLSKPLKYQLIGIAMYMSVCHFSVIITFVPENIDTLPYWWCYI